MPAIAGEYPDAIAEHRLSLCDNAYQVLEQADALVVVTEWKSFWSPDFKRIKEALSTPLLVDGRNIYDTAQVTAAGLLHCAIGRGALV